MAKKRMSRAQFDALVAQAMASIPERFRWCLENIRIDSEDRPSRELRRKMSLGPHQSLFGLYRGVPLTHRSVFQGWVYPERITLFREPLEEHFGDDPEQLVRQIRFTVIHEIGHHFGLSDADMEAAE